MNVKIELLKEEDYKFIPRLYSDCFNERPWNDDWYKIKQFDQNAVFVAKIDKDFIGFIISFLSEDTPYISVLGVKNQYRRKGIAQMLLIQCIDYWKDYEKIYLHVEEKRIEAVNFYQKNGFQMINHKDEDYEMEYRIKSSKIDK